jgi:CMP-N,N'-diacetyllegionaminic acid synthase
VSQAEGPIQKTVALIPARGGSKGLPGKNIKELLGKPLLHYTLEAALDCALIDEVYVSTDDVAIAQCARQIEGVTIIDRPAHLATDDATTVDAIWHFLDVYKTANFSWPETLVLLQPTSPLRTAVHLQEALTQYQGFNQPSQLVSVCPTKPISWQGGCLEADEKNGSSLFNFYHQNRQESRQKEKPNYALNGAIYCASSDRFYRDEFLKPPLQAYVMDSFSSVDIDTMLDFEWAEFLLSKQKK